MAIQTQELQLKVNDRQAAAYLAAPVAGGPGVLVLHAWWGLNPFFKQVCSQLAEQGFVALAPDLRNGEIATSTEAAMALMKKSDNQFTGEVVMAARDYLLSTPKTTGSQLGVLGFSMGGGWALEAAAQAPEQFAAVVVFYSSSDADFKKLKASFQGHFCEVDEWEPLDGIQAMQTDMKTAGVNAAFHFYTGVSHWFVEEDRPEFNPAAAALAWERTYNFMREHL